MRSSLATWLPVARIDDGARETKYRAAILHTNGAKASENGSLYNWWLHGSDPGVGAHIQIDCTGDIEQYLDLDRYTGHAWDANHWTWAVETEDKGDPSKPWTEEQINSIVALLREQGIPAKLLKESRSDGIGWHEQFDSWNQSNHDCPSSVREGQITNVIIPALKQPDGGEDFLAKLTEAEQQNVRLNGVADRQFHNGMIEQLGFDPAVKDDRIEAGKAFVKLLQDVLAKP